MSTYVKFPCTRCGKPMSFYGHELRCQPCQLPHPDHPESIRQKALAEAKKGQPTTVPFTPSATLATPADPRVAAIERTLDTLATLSPKKK